MCHASLWEAIHLFRSSVYSGVIRKNETWDKSTKNDWDYLFSEEASAIKREVLKYI